MKSWKQCVFLVITTMFLWQLIYLVTCMYGWYNQHLHRIKRMATKWKLQGSVYLGKAYTVFISSSWNVSWDTLRLKLRYTVLSINPLIFSKFCYYGEEAYIASSIVTRILSMFKVATTDMTYFRRSKFSKLHKKKFGLVWQVGRMLLLSLNVLGEDSMNNNWRYFCEENIIKLLLAYTFWKIFVIGQNIMHVHVTY